ncbi:di-heme oxidoreductase family protein [Rubellimicrobium arenae]|uniref:di-heme oxidoreductase family protein n=1 Tax=Rubellimicrobium arenae TaxID=2817372 RepID=UPI001B311025|nr:di-heme oxidoredictase family protein [Rubellimicrobium arenae]
MPYSSDTTILRRWAALLARPALVLPFALAGAATALEVGGWGEPHLKALPRTAAETQRIAAAILPATDFSAPQRFEDHPAGAATVRARPGTDAFSQPSGNIDFAREMDFKLGNALFTRDWVSAPSSTLAADGLGPLFNSRSCQACHLRDGRGHTPSGPDDEAVSIFLRVSVPDPDGETHGIAGYTPTAPDPVYGGQIQNFATHGHRAEARFAVTFDEVAVPLAGGETAHLRRPSYEAADLAYGPLASGAMLSPRVAPQMIGLGLLEAVPEADILSRADETDANGDGISGRPNVVWSHEFQQPMLGRFGHKAGTPTIREQSAAAFSGDMGLSTTLFPAGFGECTAAQADCRAAPVGAASGEPEVDDESLDLVAFYARNLGVPGRREADDAQVLHGKQVFYEIGCQACHQPAFVTHRLKDQPEQSFQLIWPYTDLLLHDMGEGLADHRPEGRATGTEWRTAPLWGIGLTEQVTGVGSFLHDGRARTVLEAVLWHGGEAQSQRDAVVDLDPADRAALVRFLESL